MGGDRAHTYTCVSQIMHLLSTHKVAMCRDAWVMGFALKLRIKTCKQ